MFEDRKDAGRKLAAVISGLSKKQNALVAALPKGGVPVAGAICAILGADLEIIPVRKIGSPGNREFAVGAVSLSTEYLDQETILKLGLSNEYIVSEKARLRQEIRDFNRKLGVYEEKSTGAGIVFITDDGVATGATMKAAVREVKLRGKGAVRDVYIAVPVIAREIYNILRPEVKGIFACEVAEELTSVGSFYKDFSQVSMEEVVKTYETYSRSG